jgi:hypothetical protein
VKCTLCGLTSCPTDAERRPLIAGWRLWRGDDGWIVCSRCLCELVDEACERAERVNVRGLFTDAPTVCVHGTPLTAPWCLACRLMAAS